MELWRIYLNDQTKTRALFLRRQGTNFLIAKRPIQITSDSCRIVKVSQKIRRGRFEIQQELFLQIRVQPSKHKQLDNHQKPLQKLGVSQTNRGQRRWVERQKLTKYLLRARMLSNALVKRYRIETKTFRFLIEMNCKLLIIFIRIRSIVSILKKANIVLLIKIKNT